jgi:hypothetical protein
MNGDGVNRFIGSKYVWTAIIVMGISVCPTNASCFWDEETLLITGITAGSILALGLIIVLVAGTIQDVKGDEDGDFFSKSLVYMLKENKNAVPISFFKVPCGWFPLRDVIPEKQDTIKRNIHWTQPAVSQYSRVHSYSYESPYLLLSTNTLTINQRFHLNTAKSLPLSSFAVSFLVGKRHKESLQCWSLNPFQFIENR